MGKDKNDYMECLDIKVLEQTENGYVLLYALNILQGLLSKQKMGKNRTYHLPQSRHRHFRHKIQSFLLYRSQESYTDFCFEELHHLFHLIRECHGIIKKLSTVSIK